MLAYDILGSGPALVLLPGIGGSAADTWETLLADLAAEYTVVLADLPGSGRSPLPAGPLEAGAVADQVVATAHRAGLSDFVIAGTSLGAAGRSAATSSQSPPPPWSSRPQETSSWPRSTRRNSPTAYPAHGWPPSRAATRRPSKSRGGRWRSSPDSSVTSSIGPTPGSPPPTSDGRRRRGHGSGRPFRFPAIPAYVDLHRNPTSHARAFRRPRSVRGSRGLRPVGTGPAAHRHLLPAPRR
ncbi:alpha/beta fold hydrolase [Streptomyces sp. NBC_00019]|uniref:alpha/beta fold hydrolase n=1 Tax=Streptomyces sp. NBC_00019 TaxID=2975623 RepID=UPI003866E637